MDYYDSLETRSQVAQPSDALQAAVVASIRELTKLRAEVAFQAAGALANAGKVIEDLRSYE
jgi:phenylacetate-CoA ligase